MTFVAQKRLRLRSLVMCRDRENGCDKLVGLGIDEASFPSTHRFVQYMLTHLETSFRAQIARFHSSELEHTWFMHETPCRVELLSHDERKEFYPDESDPCLTWFGSHALKLQMISVVCELIYFSQEAWNRMFVIFSLSICLVWPGLTPLGIFFRKGRICSRVLRSVLVEKAVILRKAHPWAMTRLPGLHVPSGIWSQCQVCW